MVVILVLALVLLLAAILDLALLLLLQLPVLMLLMQVPPFRLWPRASAGGAPVATPRKRCRMVGGVDHKSGSSKAML